MTENLFIPSVTSKTFEGLPCIQCSSILRYYSNKGCVACQLLRSKLQSNQSSDANRKATNYRYNHSPKGEAARKKYENSPKGKLAKQQQKKSPQSKLYDKIYRQTPLGKAITRSSQLKNKLKRRAIPGSHTGAEWLALKEQYKNRCLCCNHKEAILDRALERDHIIPITQPGATNWITNIQPLCHDCNAAKRTKTIDYRPKS